MPDKPRRKWAMGAARFLVGLAIVSTVFVGAQLSQTAVAAPVSSLKTAVSATVVNVSSKLNVRSGPSLKDKIIGGLRNGTKFTVTGYTSDGWLQIKASGIAKGYVSAQYAKVPVVSVSLSATSGQVGVGLTAQLKASIYPGCATKKTLTWASSNTKVATVSASGVVTGRAVGTATITVRTADGGKTATAKYTVVKASASAAAPSVAVTGVSVTKGEPMMSGRTQQLKATITPANATNKTVSWATSNTGTATVSAAGLVTGKVSGTGKSANVTVSVKTASAGKTASTSFKVYSVQDVQARLNALTCKGADAKALSVDGSFGANSKFATQQFQLAAKLSADGEPGPLTLTALFGSSAPKCAAVSTKPLDLKGFAYKWSGPYVTQDFLNKVLDIAAKLKANPDDIMGVMAAESGINPYVVNSNGGATGLIQFMPSTAVGLGTTTAALLKMTAVQQLDYVYKYLAPYTGKLGTTAAVCVAVLWPAAVGQPDSYVLFSQGSSAYAANTGLDTNKDGKVTVGEVAQRVIEIRARYAVNA